MKVISQVLVLKFIFLGYRAGIPSFVATLPGTFTEQDAKNLGKWQTSCVNKYQRLEGVSRRITLKKVFKALKVAYFLEFYLLPRNATFTFMCQFSKI